MTNDVEEKLHTDEDGIPMLFDVVRPGRYVDEMAPPSGHRPHRMASQHADELTASPALSSLINEIAADLDHEVTWKLEKVLQTAVNDTVHQCMQAMSASVRKSVNTHLQLMLPALVEVLKDEVQSQSPDHRPG